jgi:hypothetical protein
MKGPPPGWTANHSGYSNTRGVRRQEIKAEQYAILLEKIIHYDTNMLLPDIMNVFS